MTEDDLPTPVDDEEPASSPDDGILDGIVAELRQAKEEIPGLSAVDLNVSLSKRSVQALVLAALLVTSALVVPNFQSGPSEGEPAPGTPTRTPIEGTVYTPNSQDTPSEPNVEDFDASALNTVPATHLDSRDGPPAPDSVSATDGAQTMRVDTVSIDGEAALELADDRTHDGRWVAVDADWFKQTHGEIPETAFIAHESGDNYVSQVRVDDGDVAFYVPKFSENVIRFSGTFRATGTYQNGSSFNYEVNATVINNFTVEVTGSTATEWDNQSASGLTNGDTLTVDIAGNAQPSGPSANGEPVVVFTGRQVTGSTYTETGTGVGSFSVAGDTAPTGPENGAPQIVLEGNEETGSQTSVSGVDGDTVDPSGNVAPVGPSSNNEPEITITGETNTASESISNTDVSDGQTLSATVGGNLEPTGPSGGADPTVTFTGRASIGGDTQWSKSVGAFEHLTTSPDGTRMFTLGGSVDGKVTAYSAAGDSKWTVNYNDYSNKIAAGTSNVYVTGQAGLKAISRSTQSTVWSVSGPGAGVTVGPNSEVVYASDGSTLVAYDTADGSELWSTSIPSTAEGVVVGPSNNTVYVAAGDTFALSTSDGSTQWSDGTGGAQRVAAGPDGAAIYIGTGGGDVVRLDATDGTEEWRITHDTSQYPSVKDVAVSPDGNRVYSGAQDNVIRELDASDGSEVWSKSYGEIVEGIATADDSVFVGALDSKVESLSLSKFTTDPSLDIDGDGSAEASVAGELADGETATADLPQLTTGSQSWTASTAEYTVDIDVEFTERTATEDPSVDIDGDGTAEASRSGIYTSGESATLELSALTSASQTVDTQAAAGPAPDWTITYSPHYATEDPVVDVDGDGVSDASYSGVLYTGETATVAVEDLTNGSTTLDTSTAVGPQPDWTLTYDAELYSRSPTIDIDQDGSPEAAHNGIIAPGETATIALENLNLTDDTATIGISDSTMVDVAVKLNERTQTNTPTVEINGQTTSYDGTLSDGQTESLTVDTGWLDDTTTVNVTVGDTLSADAPKPQTELLYEHDAVDNVSVDHRAQAFAERYNVSRTYVSEKSDAELTIPYQGTVYSVKSLEIRTNESGGWSSVSESDYHLDNTTLTVNITAVYGGDVPAGTTVEVRTAGRKFVAHNASVTVTDPSGLDAPIDTTMQLDQWDQGAYLGVGNDAQGRRLHYVVDNGSTYDTSEYVVIDAQDRQRLHLPNAADSDKVRIRTLPLDFDVASNEMRVSVPEDNVSRTEPYFRVKGAGSSGDAYDVTFLNATSGETYQLYSIDNGVGLDTAQANSPVTLDGSDDTTGLFQIRLSEGSTDDGGGGGGPVGPMVVEKGPLSGISLDLTFPVTVVISLAALGGLLVLGRRLDLIDTGDRGDTVVGAARQSATALLGNPAVLGGILIVGAAAVIRFDVLPEQTGGIAALAAIPAAIALALRQFGGFDFRVWVGSTALTAALGIQVVAPELFDRIFGRIEPLIPLVVVGVIALAWRAVSAWREEAGTPDEVNRLVVDAGESDD